jgi:exosortase N
MKNFLIDYNFQIIILAIIGLFAMNYNVVVFGLDSDFFGIIFSVLLFIFGSRTTNLKVNYFLVLLILIFEFVSFRLHTKSLHFLSLLLFICLIFFGFTRKFSFVAFICILLFSSIFNKFFEHLTSEIKQSLCYGVYATLGNLLHIDRIEGVNFFIKNSKITIDTACMGLSMFKTGLLTGAILLTLEERKQQRFFSIFQIIVFCFIIIVLNIISNYFRIVTLILFNCTQENFLHHSIGLICFAFYQVLPMIFIIKYIIPKIIQNISDLKHKSRRFGISSFKFLEIKNFIGIGLALIIIFITSLEMKKVKNNDLLLNLNPKYNIKNGKWFSKEVFKIETSETLIYIKTPIHKPLICWTGDGYLITESKEIIVNNEKIWFNKMEKNNILYESIWWYELGNKKFTSFIEVMFLKLIYNEPIRLINETSRIN